MTPLTAAALANFLTELRPIEGLHDDTTLFSDGTIDSTGLIALVGYLEQTCLFEVGPADVTLENFDTINRVLAYVQSKVGG